MVQRGTVWVEGGVSDGGNQGGEDSECATGR